MSLFGAELQPPSFADLEGLLVGPGQVARRGAAARIGVVVTEPWRVAALVSELAGQLGVVAEEHEERPGRVAVRTPFLAELHPLADRWVRGAAKAAPAGWRLDAHRLRWWCLAGGRGYDPLGYTLTVGPGDELVWPTAGAALAEAGLAAAFVGPRADGPAYRLTGRRRVLRLRELVGERPPDVPAEHWPGDTVPTRDSAQ